MRLFRRQLAFATRAESADGCVLFGVADAVLHPVRVGRVGRRREWSCQLFVNKNLRFTAVFYLSLGSEMGRNGAFWGAWQLAHWDGPPHGAIRHNRLFRPF